MAVRERVAQFIANQKISTREFERRCDLSNGYVKGIKHSILPDKLRNITLRFPNLNTVWLLTGEGDMLKDGEQTPKDVPIVNYDHKGVPYYNVDFLCGFDLVVNDQTVNPDYYIDFKQYNKANFWINASGDSMRPIINSGDILAVRQLPDSEWERHVLYGETYALVLKESRTIKKIRKSRKGDEYILLVPENTADFDEQDVYRTDVQRVFQVLGCMKKMM